MMEEGSSFLTNCMMKAYKIYRFKSLLVQFLTVDRLTLALAVKILEDGFQAVSGAFVKGPGAGVLNPL